MGKVIGLKKIYKLTGARVAVSTSNRYMVRSTNSKIFLSDFKTNKIIKTVKSTCFIINNISTNDKYCVGTFNGELGIKVFSLPEVEEVVSFDVADDEYVFFVDFISDTEIVYCVRVQKGTLRVYVYDIENCELRIVYSLDSDEFDLTLRRPFWHADSLCIPLENSKGSLAKFVLWGGDSFVEKALVQPKHGRFVYCSDILNNKILINNYINEKNIVLGVYDFDLDEFTSILNVECLTRTCWLSDDLFWFSQVNIGRLGRSGLMNLKGEIQVMHDTFSIRYDNCNEEYFIAATMSSYVYEKIYEDSSEDCDQSGNGGEPLKKSD